MHRFVYVITALACLQIGLSSFAQPTKVDSLKDVLHRSGNSLQPDIFFQLAEQYWDISKDSSAFYLGLVLKSSNQEAIAKARRYLGYLYLEKGNYSEALKNYLAAVSYYEEKANTIQVANIYCRVGEIWRLQLDYEKSLSYHQSALSIYTQLNDSFGMANALNDIALTYEAKRNFETALSYHEKSLAIKKKLGNKRMLGDSYCNLGTIYRELSKYGQALEYQYKALRIDEELGDDVHVAITHNNIAALLILLGKPDEALPHLQTAEKLTQLHRALDPLKYTYLQYTRLFEKKNDYRAAYRYHQEYSAIKDSLFNSEARKQVAEMSAKYETEKKEARIKLQQAELDKKHEEVKRHSTQRNALIGGFALMLALAGVSYRNYRNKRKAHSLLEIKNKIIEEKNKDITDSITYARRIQQAKLPKREEIYLSLPQSFVLFKPKDIVSGDFYFFHKSDQSVIIAAADCTGHGVPGAIMSMIGSEKLEDAVVRSADPSIILSLLNKGIKTALKQTDGEESTRDGMDIALCAVDIENRVVRYAGANRPLWIIRNGGAQIEEIKATKTAIGGLTTDDQYFVPHEIQLQAGDTFYICSDGYADQFGGNEGKKFHTGNFKKLLLSIQDKVMPQQKEILDETFESWKGKLEQIDDVCVIGVKL